MPKIERLPRLYQSTITQRMIDATLDFQEALFDAQSQGGCVAGACLEVFDSGMGRSPESCQNACESTIHPSWAVESL